MTTRLSTQDIAAVLVEELSKIDQYITQLEQSKNDLRQDIAKIHKINEQHLTKFEALSKRRITIDASNFEQAIKQSRTLPKWAIWALILQPLIITIVTTIVVSFHIHKAERVAWNEGYNYAIGQQTTLDQ